jgi:hypothetical protein
MSLNIRFVGKVDPRLRSEIVACGRWIRRWYSFPVGLEVRFIHRTVLIDTDGAECYLRWWQNASERPVNAEIAVGLFRKNLRREGPEVAYPTVVAALGRALKYYFQAIRDKAPRSDHAERWGDRLLDAYIAGSIPPQPWRGAWSGRPAPRRPPHRPGPPNKPMQQPAFGRC